MNRLQHYIGMSICVLCLCSAQAATYEDEFTERKGSAYIEDINVWVYTSKFASRFGMPSEWVNDELKGAYAIAFRVENMDVRTLLPHKEAGASLNGRECILDVYLPDNVAIPWINDNPSGIKHWFPMSAVYLRPQTEEDWSYKRSPIGLGKELRSGVSLLSKKGYGNSLFMQHYKRKIYPGIDFVSFSMACTAPAVEDSEIQFKSVGSKKNSDLIHRVFVPQEFMQRLYTNWYNRHRNQAGKEYRDTLSK